MRCRVRKSSVGLQTIGTENQKNYNPTVVTDAVLMSASERYTYYNIMHIVVSDLYKARFAVDAD